MRSKLMLVAVTAIALLAQDRRPTLTVDLRELVPPGDPLASQGLRFDARFADVAVDYLQSGSSSSLDALAALPAARHLLDHARQFDYDVPKSSADALVRHLLSPPMEPTRLLATERASLAFFLGPMLDDRRWIADVLEYLPNGFRFRGSLFLTFGYDIGVALAPNASINGAHRHFDGHSRELLYYAIHELHHVGFMTYEPPPRLADLRTCEDMLRLVEYSTALEGMAVYAARARREAEGALQDDPDYVALEDTAQMRRLEAEYLEDYERLEQRGREPVDADARAIIERMSSGDRLWYRVGARMAADVEDVLGHDALVTLVSQRPPALVKTYRALPHHRQDDLHVSRESRDTGAARQRGRRDS